MKRTHRLIIGLTIGAGLNAGAVAQGQKDWQAPDIGKLPDDRYGQMVREGKALMEQTYKHIGPEVKDVSKRYSGNNLAVSPAISMQAAASSATRGWAPL